jgi:hypothetical protein
MGVQPKKKRSWKKIATVSVIVFVLYVLSSGPVAWLYMQTGLNMGHPVARIISYFHAPVELLCMSSDVLDSALERYLEWWTKLGMQTSRRTDIWKGN